MASSDNSSSSGKSSESETKKKKSKDETPPFKHMITEAIWEDKKWTKGTSRNFIRKFILENYDVDETKLKGKISETLSDMLEEKQKSGKGPLLIKHEANYKLAPAWRKEWKSKNGIKSVARKKKKKDKNAPKGVRNGYMFYVQENRAKRGKEHPTKEATELTKMIATEWRELSASKKKKYLDMAADDKKRYEQEMSEYKKRKRSGSGSEESEEESSKKKPRKKRKTEKSSESESSDKKKKTKKKDSESGSSEEKKKKGKRKSNSTEDDKEDSSSEKKKEGEVNMKREPEKT